MNLESLMPLKLYHVTLDTSEPINKLFVPRVPKSIGSGENDETPRICFSDSIEKCMQAIRANVDPGTIIRVYTAYIPFNDTNLIHPINLKFQFGVPDALENNEYWYTKPIILESKLYKVLSYDNGFDVAWSCINYKDLLNILNKYTTMTEIYQHNVLEDKFNSEDIWNRFSSYMLSKERYNELDEAYDAMVELPWAQILSFSNLKVELIE